LCSGKVNVSLLAEAANNVNLRLRNAVASTGKVRLDLYEIIDLRMLSGLIGEMFSTEVSKLDNRVIKNPNIDGYPDLCDISKDGKATAIQKYALSEFLAYDDGGFEVKNTFGVKKSKTHIAQCESRIIKIQKKLVWKAHHRETNHLIAIHSDYVNKVPQIIAAFYSDQLDESDWTIKQQPKEGSTMTSFCQTTPSAFLKLKNGLKFYMDGIGYEQFLR
jgi:hypothetical protein